jgi:FkbM family methyltransferase
MTDNVTELNYNMIDLKINNKERWKEFVLREARYQLPEQCKGGLCIDAGTNIGDFPINFGSRFDKYICYDVFDENIEEANNNTKDLGLDIQIHKRAVWNTSNEFIDVMAYEPWDTKDVDHFGNSGNVGCVEFTGEQGEGWSKENSIGLVSTISLESIIETYGEVNLLKVDVEGSEYNFLQNKDLSKVNWIAIELHGEPKKQSVLIDWIDSTHDRVKQYDNIKIWKRK